jgi:hypothetical protein
MAARAPATSTPKPATTVRRLLLISLAASASAAPNGAACPLMEDCDILAFPHGFAVLFFVGKGRRVGRRDLTLDSYSINRT